MVTIPWGPSLLPRDWVANRYCRPRPLVSSHLLYRHPGILDLELKIGKGQVMRPICALAYFRYGEHLFFEWWGRRQRQFMWNFCSTSDPGPACFEVQLMSSVKKTVHSVAKRANEIEFGVKVSRSDPCISLLTREFSQRGPTLVVTCFAHGGGPVEQPRQRGVLLLILSLIT